MERRVLLAIFLSFVVLYVYQQLVVKPVPKPADATPARAENPTTPTPQPTASAARPPEAGTAAESNVPSATALVGDTTERDVRVETGDVIAVFTNRGARLRSWRLKHYMDQQKQPQELVENQIPTEPLPFTLRTENDQLNATLNGRLYSVAGAPATIISSPVDIRFAYRDSAGVEVLKEF